jgi:hypothetical protein
MKLWQWRRTIARPEEPVYMVRYQLLVLGNLLRIYLNKICLPDADERLHTHPYRACWSVKLLGTYEEQLTSSQFQTPSRFSRVPYAHRITWLYRRPVWTLFIGWRRDQPWGFINPDGSLEVRP